jgi:hypothetical protein
MMWPSKDIASKSGINNFSYEERYRYLCEGELDMFLLR